jgi:hypothetical protein
MSSEDRFTHKKEKDNRKTIMGPRDTTKKAHSNIILISNTLPQAGAKMSVKPNLTIDDWSREGPTSLVNTSAVCSDEGTKDEIIIPNRTFSRIK